MEIPKNACRDYPTELGYQLGFVPCQRIYHVGQDHGQPTPECEEGKALLVMARHKGIERSLQVYDLVFGIEFRSQQSRYFAGF